VSKKEEKRTLDVLRERKYRYISSVLSRPYMGDIVPCGNLMVLVKLGTIKCKVHLYCSNFIQTFSITFLPAGHA